METDRRKLDAESLLEVFQSLQRQPGYELLMDWVNEMTRYHFEQLDQAADPMSMAKHVGALNAYKTVRARVSREITECMKVLKPETDESDE